MLNRPWWIRLLSEDGAGGAAPAGAFDDGEKPAGDAPAGDAGDAGGADAGADGTKPDEGGQGEGAGFDPKEAEKAAVKELEAEAQEPDPLDVDPFADPVEEAAPDVEDLADLLDETPPTDAPTDPAVEPESKPDAKAQAKEEPKVKDPATPPTTPPGDNPYADLDAFSYAEKAPKVLAKDVSDDELAKLLQADFEKQELTQDGIGAAFKKLAAVVRGLATRAEMTDALLANDMKAAKENEAKSRALTLDQELDQVAGSIVPETIIGKGDKLSRAQRLSREAILAEADEIITRQRAKGVDIKTLSLSRVIKAAAVKLHQGGKAAAPAKPAAPAKAAPISAKPATPAKPTTPAKPAAPATPPARSRPLTTGDAEDAALGIVSKRR